VDLVEDYLRRIAGNDDGGFDIDKIASGISSKDRNKIDVVRQIFREFGVDGLSAEELTQHGLSQGLAEVDVTRALKQLNEAGEIYKNPSGYYKLA